MSSTLTLSQALPEPVSRPLPTTPLQTAPQTSLDADHARSDRPALRQRIHKARWRRATRKNTPTRLNAWGSPDVGYW